MGTVDFGVNWYTFKVKGHENAYFTYHPIINAFD